jgi:hypothetical protein
LKKADELPPPLLVLQGAAPGGRTSFSCGDTPPLLLPMLLLTAGALPLPERFRLCKKSARHQSNHDEQVCSCNASHCKRSEKSCTTTDSQQHDFTRHMKKTLPK